MRNLWCTHLFFRMEPSTSDSPLVRPLDEGSETPPFLLFGRGFSFARVTGGVREELASGVTSNARRFI
jgi:hypothetical protein